jgi:hypothetical protein
MKNYFKSSILIFLTVIIAAASSACMPTLIGTSSLSSSATPSQVLMGEQYYDENKAIQTGTMPNQGAWNFNTAAFPGAGYYSQVSGSLSSNNVCAGTEVFGTSSVVVCENGSTSNAASSADIVAGMGAWGPTGALITGAIANQGALNAQNSFSAGYYNGTVTNLPTAAELEVGTTVFGVSGTYNGFASNTASTALRNPGSVLLTSTNQATSNQMPLSAETTTYGASDMPSTGGYNYRDIPDTTQDDEGTSGIFCNYAPRPANNCGTTQATVALRIANCAAQNPTTSTWNGASQCNGGQSTWTLVSRAAANEEVWQDNRTGLLWSTEIAASTNWCQASGNTQNAPVRFEQSYSGSAGTPMVGSGKIGSISGGSSSVSEAITITFTNSTTFTVSGSNCGAGSITAGALTSAAGSSATWSNPNYCSFTITQGSTPFAANDTFVLWSTPASTQSCAPGAAAALQPASPISYCAEAGGAFTSYPSGENWATGTYSNAKGLMGANSTPSVMWRLPTEEDYVLADVDGYKMVLPDAGLAGASRPNPDGSTGGHYDWAATTATDLLSTYQFSAVKFYTMSGYWSGHNSDSSTGIGARCVGR